MNADDTLEESPETPLLGNENERRTEEEIAQAEEPHRRQSLWKLFLSPLTDETGSGWGVVAGLTTLTIVGTTLGLLLPQNQALPTPWYRAVSSSIGYTYFSCWSVSFYPQVLSNYARKSTQGLSPDFCGLNVIGFACYSVYNLLFFFSKSVQEMYKERHGGAEVTVQSNDVAFAVHAFILSTLTFLQIGYYNGSVCAMLPSRLIGWTMVAIVVTILVDLLLVGVLHHSSWLDFLYLLSYVKVFISLIKYIPQVFLNMKLKSTRGWTIWNVLLDFSGGTLSDLQLVLDCADMGDFAGITGNLAKFCLGSVSILFDIIFMLQHYVIYRGQEPAPLVAPPSQVEDERESDGDDCEEVRNDEEPGNEIS